MLTSSGSFTFAVVADAHIRLDGDSESGEYPSNLLANARNQRIVQQINRLAPDLVIHLGDFVHPIPALPAFAPTMQAAYELYQRLDADLHVLPGNHDIGDKPNAWTPAPAVTGQSHAIFERYWGPTWSSFDYRGCHFVLINTPILNSGLPREAAQQAWLERDLAANRKRGNRVFLFTHYPLYLTHPQETAHYDNIGQPARDWLLSLLDQYQVEALFAGHVHHFFYNRYRQTDLYVLPSVAFTRPGFSELFAVEPAAEYGRNDAQKLGFALVTVEREGYRFQLVRAGGITADMTTSPSLPSNGRQGGTEQAGIGIFLRQAWADPLAMPCGNLDEFGRKRARNDYLLWGLWELGIRKLRVPLDDLADANTRERIRALHALGHEFTVFSVGIPERRVEEMMAQYQEVVAAWELILPREQIPAGRRRIQEIKGRIPIPVHFSKLETLADQHQEQGASQIDHFARHGFRLEEADMAVAQGAAGHVDGVVFRLTAATRPWEGIHAARRLAQAADMTAVVHVQLPRASEGVAYIQDLEIANRIAETIVAAASSDGVELFLDTFIDHDRGYYPRRGLLDRRYNPRPAYDVFRRLVGVLGNGRTRFRAHKITATYAFDAFALETASCHCILLLSRNEETPAALNIAWAAAPIALEGMGRWLNLQTGQTSAVRWRQSPAGADQIQVDNPAAATQFYPALFFVT